MTKPDNDHQKLWDLIKDTRFGMLTHRHPDGSLHSHPLTTQNRTLDEQGVLYFFVSRKSELGQRLQADGNVAVSYADTDKDAYVSVSGKAAISEDMDKKKELFSVMAKAWFPGGHTDPDLELVEVRMTHAEFWDTKLNRFSQLIRMATAAATGKPPHDMGEHKELSFAR
jgi:general stress protein 26